MELLRVRVVPRAGANRVKVEAGPDGGVVYRVYVTAVPEDGKANAAVIELLAAHLGVAKSRLEIERGGSGRDKLVRVR